MNDEITDEIAKERFLQDLRHVLGLIGYSSILLEQSPCKFPSYIFDDSDTTRLELIDGALLSTENTHPSVNSIAYGSYHEIILGVDSAISTKINGDVKDANNDFVKDKILASLKATIEEVKQEEIHFKQKLVENCRLSNKSKALLSQFQLALLEVGIESFLGSYTL